MPCWRPARRFSRARHEEITANLRPNPVLLGDALFIPVFQPSDFNSTYMSNSAQFDLGVSYLFERGEEAAAPARSGEGPDGGDALTGGGQRAQPDVSGSVGLFTSVELAESTLDLAQSGPEELPEHGGHQPGPLQGRRHQRGRLPEDQAADAAVSDGRVAGPAREGAGAFGFAAIARIRVGPCRLRRGRAIRVPAGKRQPRGSCR